jgi:hypothetical protein
MVDYRPIWMIDIVRDGQFLHPKNESSAAEDVVTEEYLLLQTNLFFWSR